MKKLAIISTHPIQYNAPLFAAMARDGRMQVKVFYTWSQTETQPPYDPGFKQQVRWDIPLLEGYDYAFIQNVSDQPGSHHYKGIKNPDLISSIRTWGADALLVYGWNYQSHLQALRYFHKRIPIFFRGDSTLLDEQAGLKKLIRRIILRWVYQHVTTALYTGKNNRAYYLAAGMKEEQLRFAPHCINNIIFEQNEAERKREALELRKRLGIMPGETVFLFAGKLEAKKNPMLLLRSFLASRQQHTHLVFAGNGEWEEALRNTASSNTRVHFLGFCNQSEMPAVYYMADVLVLPSEGPGETWGLCINEAMTCAKAVVVSDKAGCAADLVRNGENGFVFACGQYEQLTDILNYFTDHPEKAQEFGAISRKIIADWSLPVSANKTMESISSVFHQSTTPSV